MHPTTPHARFPSDQPTMTMDAHDETVTDPVSLQHNRNVVNTPGADRLRSLRSLVSKRAAEPTPEGVRNATPSAFVNLGLENRLLFEQKRSPRQIATYHELRMHGIPANRILLEPRASSYSQPDVRLKETILHGDAPTLALRVHHGANLNESDEAGTPALVTAAAIGKVAAVLILAGAGAALDARDANCRTALLAASAAGHVDTVIALLPYFPDLDATDAQGMTALMHLCVHGHQNAARLLLANGANPDLRTADGRDARRLAHQHGHDSIFSEFDRMQDDHDEAGEISSDSAMQ